MCVSALNIYSTDILFLGLYDIEGTIADFAKLFGKGLFDIKLHNINAVGHVKLRLKGISGLEMTEFNLMPSIESMKVRQKHLLIKSLICVIPIIIGIVYIFIIYS